MIQENHQPETTKAHVAVTEDYINVTKDQEVLYGYHKKITNDYKEIINGHEGTAKVREDKETGILHAKNLVKEYVEGILIDIKEDYGRAEKIVEILCDNGKEQWSTDAGLTGPEVEEILKVIKNQEVITSLQKNEFNCVLKYYRSLSGLASPKELDVKAAADKYKEMICVARSFVKEYVERIHIDIKEDYGRVEEIVEILCDKGKEQWSTDTILTEYEVEEISKVIKSQGLIVSLQKDEFKYVLKYYRSLSGLAPPKELDVKAAADKYREMISAARSFVKKYVKRILIDKEEDSSAETIVRILCDKGKEQWSKDAKLTGPEVKEILKVIKNQEVITGLQKSEFICGLKHYRSLYVKAAADKYKEKISAARSFVKKYVKRILIDKEEGGGAERIVRILCDKGKEQWSKDAKLTGPEVKEILKVVVKHEVITSLQENEFNSILKCYRSLANLIPLYDILYSSYCGAFKKYDESYKACRELFDDYVKLFRCYNVTFAEYETKIEKFLNIMTKYNDNLDEHKIKINGYREGLLGHRASVGGYSGNLKKHEAVFKDYRESLPGHRASVGGYSGNLDEHKTKVDGYRVGLQDHGASVEDYSGNLEKHEVVVKEYRKDLQGHSAELGKYSVNLDGHKVKVDGYRVGLQGHSAGVGEYSVNLDGHKVKVDGYRVGLQGHSAGVGEYSVNLDKHSDNLDEHSDNLDKHKTKVDKYAEKLRKLNDEVAKIRGKLKGERETITNKENKLENKRNETEELREAFEASKAKKELEETIKYIMGFEKGYFVTCELHAGE